MRQEGRPEGSSKGYNEKVAIVGYARSREKVCLPLCGLFPMDRSCSIVRLSPTPLGMQRVRASPLVPSKSHRYGHAYMSDWGANLAIMCMLPGGWARLLDRTSQILRV